MTCFHKDGFCFTLIPQYYYLNFQFFQKFIPKKLKTSSIFWSFCWTFILSLFLLCDNTFHDSNQIWCAVFLPIPWMVKMPLSSRRRYAHLRTHLTHSLCGQPSAIDVWRECDSSLSLSAQKRLRASHRPKEPSWGWRQPPPRQGHPYQTHWRTVLKENN